MRVLSVLLVALIFGASVAHAGNVNGFASVEAGIPALSREWSGADYAQAAQVLAAGKLPLPRLTDEQGRLFLQRLTSEENFSLYRNRSLPIQQRMEGFFKLMGGANAIAKQYMAAANKGLDVHREIAQQLAFLLHVTAVSVQLIDEFLPTVPKDEQYPVRMAGLKQTYSGLTTAFVGAETSLSETRFYSPDDLTILLNAMSETLPAVKKAFSPDYKIELRKKLESHRSAFPRAEDTQNIQRMIDELGA